jgi:hypothetical protein
MSFLFTACASSGLNLHNDNGSEPLNEKERIEYKRAVLKCYKIGGNRVVKIEGELKCF